MSNPQRPRSARLELAQAIEIKVHRLDLDSLLKLAADLDVKIPPALRKGRAAGKIRARKVAQKRENVLAGSGVGPVVSSAEGARILDAIAVDVVLADWAESELVGAGELVRRLKIARGTLDNWRRTKKIIAFRKGLRNYLYPVRQFAQLHPVDGLDRVAAHFSSHEEAWEWLVAPNRMTGGEAPIDRLREGEVEQVADAAEGALDYA